MYTKIPEGVHKFNGDRAQMNYFIRDTMKEFCVLILAYMWTELEQFTTVQNQILISKAKDHWDEACDVGNGPDNPVDPDAPQQDDFEQVVTNFISEIAGQVSPE